MSAGGGGWVGGYEGYNMSGRKRGHGGRFMFPASKTYRLGGGGRAEYTSNAMVASVHRRGGSRGSFAAKYAGRGSRPGPAMYRKFRGLRRYPTSGIETKFFDSSVAVTGISVTQGTAAVTGLEINPATVLCLNSMVQGTGASQRDGRKITMESVQLTGSVAVAAQATQTAADTKPIITIFVVLDKQTNGGTATGLDSENVWTNPAARAEVGGQFLRNMLYTKRYKVLKEINVDVKSPPIVAEGAMDIEQAGVHTPWDCYVPLKGLGVEFLGNAGTVADIVNNGLFVCACTSSGSFAPLLSYNARLRYRG